MTLLLEIAGPVESLGFAMFLQAFDETLQANNLGVEQTHSVFYQLLGDIVTAESDDDFSGMFCRCLALPCHLLASNRDHGHKPETLAFIGFSALRDASSFATAMSEKLDHECSVTCLAEQLEEAAEAGGIPFIPMEPDDFRQHRVIRDIVRLSAIVQDGPQPTPERQRREELLALSLMPAWCAYVGLYGIADESGDDDFAPVTDALHRAMAAFEQAEAGE